MPESQTWREPTTVVAIEWDYYNSPVVDKSPGVDGVKELHPEELGLSADLSDRLMSWMDRHSGPDDDPEPGLAREELTLAYDLQRELGPDITVLYEGRPVEDRRGP